MTGPAVDIFKQTIAGHSLVDVLNRMRRDAKREGEVALKEIWAAFAAAAQTNAPHWTPAYSATPGALPEIRHTDKIEVKAISDGFAETSETTWQKLKGELFQAGLDESDVRAIAKTLANFDIACHGGGSSPKYEYRKVQP